MNLKLIYNTQHVSCLRLFGTCTFPTETRSMFSQMFNINYCSTLYRFWKYIDVPYKVDTAPSHDSSNILSAENNLYLIPTKAFFCSLFGNINNLFGWPESAHDDLSEQGKIYPICFTITLTNTIEAWVRVAKGRPHIHKHRSSTGCQGGGRSPRHLYSCHRLNWFIRRHWDTSACECIVLESCSCSRRQNTGANPSWGWK